MPRVSSRTSTSGRNLVAACVTVLSVGILHCSFDPAPAGENISTNRTTTQVPLLQESIVPLPPGVTGEAVSKTADTLHQKDGSLGGRLNNQETIKFCMLLLQDGARLMENIDDYTVVFHKEERINGDLKPAQMIDMKVQHKPHFAVYMKWMNGEKGRQVLYSDHYDDGCLSLKFGGFKKILPALRVDPNGISAKAESRYPVTQAGVLTMIRKLLAHREKDLKLNDGVTCVRLGNKEFDGRDCYQFKLTYASREVDDKYRKHLVMIDSQLHIPLIVQNYTWAEDSQEVSPEKLDAETLVENYSFTKLNLTSKLVAADFSRDNPKYRM